MSCYSREQKPILVDKQISSHLEFTKLTSQAGAVPTNVIVEFGSSNEVSLVLCTESLQLQKYLTRQSEGEGLVIADAAEHSSVLMAAEHIVLTLGTTTKSQLNLKRVQGQLDATSKDIESGFGQNKLWVRLITQWLEALAQSSQQSQVRLQL